MPYKNKEPRPYKKEYKQQKARKSEHPTRRMERQRARRKIDAKEGKDANKNGVGRQARR